MFVLGVGVVIMMHCVVIWSCPALSSVVLVMECEWVWGLCGEKRGGVRLEVFERVGVGGLR